MKKQNANRMHLEPVATEPRPLNTKVDLLNLPKPDQSPQPLPSAPQPVAPATNQKIHLEVGHTDKLDVVMVINKNSQIGPITFSPDEARNLGLMLIHKAAEGEILRRLEKQKAEPANVPSPDAKPDTPPDEPPDAPAA